ncbi:MAG: hypothetical protein AAFV93_01870 [Chloroflexota bacterium]
MTDETNLEQMAMALYVYAAELVKEGKSRQQIIDNLMERGVSRQSAETIMTRLNESRNNVTRRSAIYHLVFGIALIVLSTLPLLGIIVPQADTIGTGLAIIIMAIGVVITGRGTLKWVASLRAT